MKSILFFFFCVIAINSSAIHAQHSVAREWNEVLLEAIRTDFARPTVHARNLFHISAAMYDAWAVYDEIATPYFLGNSIGGFEIPFSGIQSSGFVEDDRNEAISYASYRLLKHRFEFSPGATKSDPLFDSLMVHLEYDPLFTSIDYSTGSAAALGNYIAEKIIEFGLQDGSNELFGYGNLYYEPDNEPLDPVVAGNPDLSNPNRWQPLKFGSFIDQSGNPIPTSVPKFIGAEWGEVIPFSLSSSDLTLYNRDGYNYHVYYDPGPPPYIDTTSSIHSEEYAWTFSLVSTWSSHLDPADNVAWDISPNSIGNSSALPETFEEYKEYYDILDGGDSSMGWDLNPITGQAYEEQIVPRADYARVLAEFWADGPDSETPPGHWFTILNYVSDHPLFEKQYKGQGELLNDLEWDVKSYFLLGGSMHDAAITAWGIKGWYDYIRPISALRFMADRGQSSNPELPNYHPAGIPLIPDFIELITENDPLIVERDSVELENTIKLKAWRNHFEVDDPKTDTAGVGWIPAGEWWSYQRPTFVTPPFAGYISGHSTFSRAAADVMSFLTGDDFFPGGLGEFHAPKNEFLVFENGPSVDLTLQWATYQDASDQTSLSRIWGGIHPPADDIKGREIGIQIAKESTQLADDYFNGMIVSTQPNPVIDNSDQADISPNPVQRGVPLKIQLQTLSSDIEIRVYNIIGQRVSTQYLGNRQTISLNTSTLSPGFYIIQLKGASLNLTKKIIVVR